MKNKTLSQKKSFLNKFFIKLIRKFGYEVIDQANLSVPTKELNINENLSQSGKQSISIPLGKTEITRKVKSLTIIIRSYTFGDADNDKVMLDQNKKRIFDLPKIEYTLRTIRSIIKSKTKTIRKTQKVKRRKRRGYGDVSRGFQSILYYLENHILTCT